MNRCFITASSQGGLASDRPLIELDLSQELLCRGGFHAGPQAWWSYRRISLQCIAKRWAVERPAKQGSSQTVPEDEIPMFSINRTTAGLEWNRVIWFITALVSSEMPTGAECCRYFRKWEGRMKGLT